MVELNLTEQEIDLIQSIRNFRKTYPKSDDLEWYIRNLLDEMLDD